MTGYTYIARNGSDAHYNDAELAILENNRATADAWLADNAAELGPEFEDRMVSYGQDYYYDGGFELDDENELTLADDLEALHDLTTDDMDKIELHGQTYLCDLQCYREIGTGSQRDRAPELVNMETRADVTVELKAERAAQLRRHLKLDRATRGQTVAAGIIKSKQRADKRQSRMARKVAAAEARAEKMTPRFKDAESNAARADRAAEARLDDYLNR